MEEKPKKQKKERLAEEGPTTMLKRKKKLAAEVKLRVVCVADEPMLCVRPALPTDPTTFARRTGRRWQREGAEEEEEAAAP